MSIVQILTLILQKLINIADPSNISTQIMNRRAGIVNSETALIDKISLKVMNNNPGTSLSFIKLIAKEVVAEYKLNYYPE